MSRPSLSSLPLFDRSLLRTLEGLVPQADRDEWSRAWQAELWHVHHRGAQTRKRSAVATRDLCVGILRDACWLRSESWRRALSGTAILCLASLLGLSLLSTLFALLLGGSWHTIGSNLGDEGRRSLVALPLVLFVAFATTARRHIEPDFASRRYYRMKRQLFFVAKVAQVLLLAFLLSAEICLPLHASMPGTADLAQLFCFVSFSLLGLRWAFRDQEERCKQCLQSLATPERVGRPSHNLLEWNGTELSCKRGHGSLNIPEIETSWCQSSQWKALDPDFHRLTTS